MMNRFFTLLFAASCYTAVGQSSYDSSADSNGDGCVQLDDLLNILGSYGSCVDLNFDCTLASQLFKLPVAIRDSLAIYFVPGEFTWFEGEAIAQCLSSSGHLATITSSEQAVDYWQEVEDFSFWTLYSLDTPPNFAWFGFFQDTLSGEYSEPSGGWGWVSGDIAEMSMSIENFNDDDGMGNEGIIYPSGEVNDGIGGACEMPIFIQVPIANQ